jgi:putative hydrolase of the HAD superfamily
MEAPIRALLLDIGGVLLTNGWDRQARARAAQQFGLDPDDLQERHNLTYSTYEEGKIDLDEYLRRTVFHTERGFSPQEVKDFMFSCSRPLPENLAYFTSLKRRHGLKYIAVSNEGREITRHRIRAFDLPSIIDFFVCSCFVHIRKPDEDIFRIALDGAQVEPERVAYVDDRALFVQIARSLGVRGVHHTDLETTRAFLSGCGLE